MTDGQEKGVITGERGKIPLLPNRTGKRSGTMTMVTTLTKGVFMRKRP